MAVSPPPLSEQRKMNLRTFSPFLMVMAAATLLAAPKPASVLTIGDPAPSIKTAVWLKGDKITTFKKGSVYVVEFWATWCGPCKENIPHLTELAKKYKGKASIIGISIWENHGAADPNTLKKVKAFVQSQGSKMDYHVAADDKANSIADSWMKPANEGGIPCSFIVDGSGRVAWIGHPAKMEEALVKVFDGKMDLKAARAARETELKFTRPIDEALAKKDYPALLKIIDQAVAERPELEYSLTYNRLISLFHVSLEKGRLYSEKILKDSNGAPGAYHMISSIFASHDDLSKEAYRFGLTIAAKGMEVSPENTMLNCIEAEIHFHLGDKASAVASIKKAIEKAKAEPRTTKEFHELLDKSLKKYEKMQG